MTEEALRTNPQEPVVDSTSSEMSSEECQKSSGEETKDPDKSAATKPSTSHHDHGDAEQEEGAKYKDQLLRALADFENYKKRSRKDLDDAVRTAKSDFLRDFLPIFDNLERALSSAATTQNTQSSSPEHALNSVLDGIKLVMKQYVETLTRHSITKTPGVGSPFDPQFHEAISHIESDTHEAKTVIAEVQPGYLYGEKLMRAALVVVAKPKSS